MPHVRYEYAVQGRTFHGDTLWLDERRSFDSANVAARELAFLETGTEAEVIYNPQDPHEAALMVDKPTWRYFFLALLGLLFARLGLGVLAERAPPAAADAAARDANRGRGCRCSRRCSRLAGPAAAAAAIPAGRPAGGRSGARADLLAGGFRRASQRTAATVIAAQASTRARAPPRSWRCRSCASSSSPPSPAWRPPCRDWPSPRAGRAA